MGQSPSTTSLTPVTPENIGLSYPVGATYRVVRIHKRVTEFYSTAGSVAAALAAAQAAPPTAWRTRNVLAYSPSGTAQGAADPFEYDVVASDVATAVV